MKLCAGQAASTSFILPEDHSLRWHCLFTGGGPQSRFFETDIRRGAFTNLLNPKMVLFVLALFPQFVKPEAGSLILQMLVLATVLNGIGLIVNGSVILLSTHVRNRIKARPSMRRLPQYLLATVFAALACRLALGGRN